MKADLWRALRARRSVSLILVVLLSTGTRRWIWQRRSSSGRQLWHRTGIWQYVASDRPERSTALTSTDACSPIVVFDLARAHVHRLTALVRSRRIEHRSLALQLLGLFSLFPGSEGRVLLDRTLRTISLCAYSWRSGGCSGRTHERVAVCRVIAAAVTSITVARAGVANSALSARYRGVIGVAVVRASRDGVP